LGLVLAGVDLSRLGISVVKNTSGKIMNYRFPKISELYDKFSNYDGVSKTKFIDDLYDLFVIKLKSLPSTRISGEVLLNSFKEQVVSLKFLKYWRPATAYKTLKLKLEQGMKAFVVSGYMNYQIAKAELSATNELILYELNTSSRGVVVGRLENVLAKEGSEAAKRVDLEVFKNADGSFGVRVELAGTNLLALYPNIRKSLSEIDGILKSAGFDRYRFENLLRQSDNLKYLEENANLLPEIAGKIKPKMQYTDADVLKIFKDAVNSDFVKMLLPSDFVASLKTFGRLDDNGVLVKFTDDEIVNYFRNYHNVYTKGEFFTQIENILLKNNLYNLTKKEAYMLWGYTTNLFYRNLNICLRDGKYTTEIADIVSTLKSAMQKVPKYNGTAYRALEFKGNSLTQFLNKYGVEGSEVTFDDFLSAGSTKEAAFFDKPEKNVRIIMEVKDAPIISSVADGIKFRGYTPEELLLNTGRKFIIQKVNNKNGIYEIIMNQVN
jgi:hypothetical protein